MGNVAEALPAGMTTDGGVMASFVSLDSSAINKASVTGVLRVTVASAALESPSATSRGVTLS